MEKSYSEETVWKCTNKRIFRTEYTKYGNELIRLLTYQTHISIRQFAFQKIFRTPNVGLEPTTVGLRVQRSTYWASRATSLIFLQRDHLILKFFDHFSFQRIAIIQWGRNSVNWVKKRFYKKLKSFWLKWIWSDNLVLNKRASNNQSFVRGIFLSEVSRVIHCATRPSIFKRKYYYEETISSVWLLEEKIEWLS